MTCIITPFGQILVAGIGSDIEFWRCRQPGLKWLSFNSLCEIGGWIQFHFWMCPYYKLVGFVFPNLRGPEAVVLFSLRAEEGYEPSLWLLYIRLSGLHGHDPGGFRKCSTLLNLQRTMLHTLSSAVC